jgi:hypothetical protein
MAYTYRDDEVHRALFAALDRDLHYREVPQRSIPPGWGAGPFVDPNKAVRIFHVTGVRAGR